MRWEELKTLWAICLCWLMELMETFRCRGKTQFGFNNGTIFLVHQNLTCIRIKGRGQTRIFYDIRKKFSVYVSCPTIVFGNINHLSAKRSQKNAGKMTSMVKLGISFTEKELMRQATRLTQHAHIRLYSQFISSFLSSSNVNYNKSVITGKLLWIVHMHHTWHDFWEMQWPFISALSVVEEPH